MPLDLTHGVLGEILVDLGDDERPNVGMESASLRDGVNCAIRRSDEGILVIRCGSFFKIHKGNGY
jgi:hypothetical protein